MKCTPLTTPTTKPLHAAVRSTAKAPVAPMAACTVHADPNRSSGEEVERRMRSRSSAATPAAASAFWDASAASEVRDSSPEMTCLLPMPVRVRIHSSLVSTSSERSSLVRYCVGTAIPTPAIFAPAGVKAARAMSDAPRARDTRAVLPAVVALHAPPDCAREPTAKHRGAAADIDSVVIVAIPPSFVCRSLSPLSRVRPPRSDPFRARVTRESRRADGRRRPLS
mmetsp:Transcript_5117/g.22855  ORF Transcript_5117/g.22855 Transcript_5117/m.22855 type:complete len:224 (-) Transcript_5117:75-746(-)